MSPNTEAHFTESLRTEKTVEPFPISRLPHLTISPEKENDNDRLGIRQ